MTKKNAKALARVNRERSKRIQAVSGNHIKGKITPWYNAETPKTGKKSKCK